MLFIDVMTPQGALTEQERQALAGRLTARRLLAGTHDAVDPGVLGLLDSLTSVVVREERIWTAGAVDPSRYVVNVTVGVWGKEMSDHLVSRISAEVAATGADVMVNVISVPEGGYGLRGRVLRSPDMLDLIEQARTGATGPVPEGMVVDPVCGATLPIEDAVWLERDGRTYGFCCPHCRGHFAKRWREAADA